MTDYGDAGGPVQTDPGGPLRGRTDLERAVDQFFDSWFTDGHPGLTDAVNAMLDARNRVSYADVNLFSRRAEARPVETDR